MRRGGGGGGREGGDIGAQNESSLGKCWGKKDLFGYGS